MIKIFSIFIILTSVIFAEGFNTSPKSNLNYNSNNLHNKNAMYDLNFKCKFQEQDFQIKYDLTQNIDGPMDLDIIYQLIGFHLGISESLFCGYLTSTFKYGENMEKMRDCIKDFENTLNLPENNKIRKEREDKISYILKYGTKTSLNSIFKNGLCKFEQKYKNTTDVSKAKLYKQLLEKKEETYPQFVQCIKESYEMKTMAEKMLKCKDVN